MASQGLSAGATCLHQRATCKRRAREKQKTKKSESHLDARSPVWTLSCGSGRCMQQAGVAVLRVKQRQCDERRQRLLVDGRVPRRDHRRPQFPLARAAVPSAHRHSPLTACTVLRTIPRGRGAALSDSLPASCFFPAFHCSARASAPLSTAKLPAAGRVFFFWNVAHPCCCGAYWQ